MTMSSKYKINCNFFDKIDTAEKAYILGFLFADGSVNSRKTNRAYEIKLSLHKKDRHILEKINTIIESNKPLYVSKNKTYYSLCITNKQIYNALLSHDLMPNKTFSIRYPMWLKPHLRFHFIRGYFDGDGYFAIDKRKKATGSWAICGNKEFCLDVKSVFDNNSISSTIYKNKRQKIFELRVSKFKDISSLYQKLYFGATDLFLMRKHDKIISLFNRK